MSRLETAVPAGQQERLSGAELRARREALGMGRGALARCLGNRIDTIRHWEGQYRGEKTPYRLRDQLSEIEAETDDSITDLEELISQIESGLMRPLAVLERYKLAIRDYGWTWWRVICVRAYGARTIPPALLTPPEDWEPISDDG